MKKFPTAFAFLSTLFTFVVAVSSPAHAQVNSTVLYEDFNDITDWSVSSCWVPSTQQAINGTSARCNSGPSDTTDLLYRSFDLSGSTKIYIVISYETVNFEAGVDTLNVSIAVNGGADTVIASILGTNTANTSASFRISSADGVNNFTLKFTCREDVNNDRCLADDLFIINEVAPYLEVDMETPDPAALTNIIQNQTFAVNATVFCRNADCGNVNGTLRYNATSGIPDTQVSATEGGTPVYIQEPPYPSQNMKECITNPLVEGESCNITWVVNASGNIGTGWSLGVLFNSSDSAVLTNHTDNATLSITGCSVDLTVQWSSISFGALNPSTVNNSAPGNSVDQYNVTVNPGSCATDLYIRGTDLENTTLNRNISVGNITWSNISSDFSDGAFRMLNVNTIFSLNTQPDTNVTTWYWIDVPSIFSGLYNATVFITGVESGDPPP